MARFSWLIKVKGFKKGTFPLVVDGMNSVVAYPVAQLFEISLSAPSASTWAHFFQFLGASLEPFFEGAAVLFVYRLCLFWMYHRKLFLKI
jgi:heparan-alpha-glucosaminide N-acetyltransferase